MNNESAKTEDGENPDTWARDQQKLGYYYDDAHGYKIYNPDEDEDEDENEEILLQINPDERK